MTRAVPGSTYPARAPRRAIDALLVRDLKVSAVRVAGPVDGLDDATLRAASDHLPVVATLTRRDEVRGGPASRG